MQFLGVTLVVPIAMLASAASASAVVHHPTGDYAKFSQCPWENPAVEICVDAETKGNFSFGGDAIPVIKPEIFEGGYSINPETGKETFVAPLNGEELIRVPQIVPAGLLANVRAGRYPGYLRAFCKNFPLNSVCKLTAAAEVVGEPDLNTTNLLSETGVALEVPAAFHLKNPFLGSKCYLGSASEPILFKFTTGVTDPPPPNLPIHGVAGHLELLEESSIITTKGATLVDNAFALPVVHGCGGPQAIVVDKEFNEINELPEAPGKSSIELTGELSIASAAAVKASEEA